MPKTDVEIVEDGFAALIYTLDGELLLEEIDAEMRKLIREVRLGPGSKKEGILTLKLTFKQGEYEGTIAVLPDLTIKLPKKDRHKTLAFTNSKHGLTLDKPENVPLFKIDPETGEIE